MVAPRTVTPEELGQELQSLLSSYPFRLLYSVKGKKFHLLVDYTSTEGWDPEIVATLIRGTIEGYAVTDVREVHLYGKPSTQRSPAWHYPIPVITAEAPNPNTGFVHGVGLDSTDSFFSDPIEPDRPYQDPSLASGSTGQRLNEVFEESEAEADIPDHTMLGNEVIMMGRPAVSPGSLANPNRSAGSSPSQIPVSQFHQAETPLGSSQENPTVEPTSKSGITLGGRYQVLKVLGSGGFGRTFLAEDQQRPGKPTCVVKQLRPKFSDPNLLDNARRLFNVEAETLEQLGRHDQIPRLLAYFEEEGDFFLVQEFVKGHSLSQEIAVEPLSEPKVLTLLEDLLKVLDFIHQHHVIHRDIKPENVIRREEDGHLVLIDFGAGKQLQGPDAGRPETMAIGTLGYNPPEQYSGSPQLNSDLYALGMVAIQCLTGLAPTQLSQDPKTGQVQWQQHVKVTDKLADIINSMVKIQYQLRYQSAADVLRVIERHFHPSPLSLTTVLKAPRIQGAIEQLKKPKVFITASLGTLGAILFIFGLSWFRYSYGLKEARFDYYLGLIYAQMEQWPQASREYQEALQRNSLYARARAALAHAQGRMQDFQNTIPDYQAVVQQQPQNVRASVDLARAHYQTDEADTAIIILNAAALSDSEDPDLFYHLGRAHAVKQEWTRARDNYLKAVELRSTFVDARIHLGLTFIELNDYAAATETLRIATELSTNNQIAYYHLGRAQALAEDWDAAIENYLTALALNSDYLDMRQDLGYGLYGPDQLDRALQAYTTQLRQTPSSELHYRLGNAYYAQGNLDAAEASYLDAIREDVLAAEPHIMLGQVLAEQRDWEGAKQTLETALAIAQDTDNQEASVNALKRYGTVLVEQAITQGQSFDEAVQRLQAALSLDGRDATTYLKLGLVFAQQGETDSAIDNLNSSVQLNPQNPDAHRFLGDSLAQQGNIDSAIAAYNTALDKDPADPSVHLSLAGAQAQQGDTDTALTSVKTAATLEEAAAATAPEAKPPRSLITQALTAQSATRNAGQVKQAIDPDGGSLSAEQQDQLASSQEPAAVFLSQAEAEDLVDPDTLAGLAGEPNPIFGYNPTAQGLISSIILTGVIIIVLVMISAAGIGYMIVMESVGPRVSLGNMVVGAARAVTRQRTQEEKLRILAKKPYRRGLSYFEGGRWNEAIPEFKEAIRTDKEFADAYFFLAQCHDELKSYKEAIAHYKTVDQLDPQYVGLTPLLVKSQLRYGYDLFESQDFDAAIEQFQSALLLRPEDAETHYYMGYALSRLKDAEAWERAVIELSLALNLQSGLAPAHSALGYVHGRRREFELAISAYQEAIAIDPDLAEAHHGLGLALYKHGDLRMAIQHFSNVMRLNSATPSLRTDLGFALLQTGDLDYARSEFNTAVTQDPELASANLGMAQVFYLRGKIREAEDWCRKALERDPDQPSAQAMVGLIHLEKHKQASLSRNIIGHRTVEIAQAKFETAIKTDLYVPEAHYGLGEISRMRREYAFAVESYTNALKSNGSFTAAHFKLGIAYYALGNLAKAREAFQKTIEFNPNYPEARAYLERTRVSKRDAPKHNNTFIDINLDS